MHLFTSDKDVARKMGQRRHALVGAGLLVVGVAGVVQGLWRVLA